MKLLIGATTLLLLIVATSAVPFCPLCGQFPVEQAPPPLDGEVTFNFDICCPFTDTMENDCIVNSKTESERTTGLLAPIVDAENFVELCMILDDFVFETSDRSPCCESCTCFGDPNCVSFDGTKETWIVCDARKVRNNVNKRDYCPLRKDQCDQEIDPLGQPCVWGPDAEGIPANEWSVKQLGSPCQPTGTSFIQMYQADTFNLVVGQGERGNIIEIDLALETGDYVLTAESCVNNGLQDSWSGTPINDNFQRSEEMFGKNGFNDVLWHVYDPDTKISVEIRCTAHLINGVLATPRMNVESVNEPNAAFREERFNLAGFCVSNDLGNTNPSPNTIFIAENGYCTVNGPTNDVEIARIVCENPAILANGVGQCQKQFCNEYYIPFYDNFEDCFETISNTTNPNRWIDGFCGAFTQLELDFFECEQTILEFGWEEAVNIYYTRDRPTENCLETFEDLPDTLEECEPGVLLQYLDPESEEWVTVKAISEIQPPCSDAEIKVCFDTNPELFLNQVRWVQTRNTENCLVGTCQKQDGFAVRMKLEVETFAPTNSPSSSPSRSPSSSPSDSPSSSPSASPSSSPSASPTVQPTSDPTDAPTPDPTGTPTPPPTDSPTPDPTGTPTPPPTDAPTPDPTGTPTPPPTDAPTPDPTGTPTPPPTDTPTPAPLVEPTPPPTDTPTPPPTDGPTPPPTPTDQPSTPTLPPTPTDQPSTPTTLPVAPGVLPTPPPLVTIAPTPGQPTLAPTAPTPPPRPPTPCPEPIKTCPVVTESVNEPLPEGIFQRLKIGKDIVWIITEPESQISTKIRCTANFPKSTARNPRLGIEDLIDPFPERREKQCGYCPTDVMGRTGDNANTDALDASGACSSRPPPVEIGQAICAPYLQFETFDECVTSICSRFWFPNYNSPSQCENVFNSNEENGFCRLFNTPNTPDFEECLGVIMDDGWVEAAERYMVNPNQDDCSSNPDDFPEELSDCQTGAEIQYLNNNGVWVTYRAVPSESNRPLCTDGMIFNANADRNLFVNPVRIKQRSVPRDSCITTSTCTPVQRINTELIYERVSACADAPPTPNPTPLPPVEGVTLCNSVYDSNQCVDIPQFSSPGSFSSLLSEMPECCAPKDTESVDGTPLDQDYEFERYSQACNPICDTNDENQCCDELTNGDELRVKVAFSGSERDALCCESCTCYGDPRCISFSGKKESWIPCDARDASTADDRKFCLSTRELCESTSDPAGNQCVFFPKGDTSDGWNVLINGGPCKAVGEGEFSCLTMYETESFGMCLKQGDRGIIVSAVVTLGSTDYMIDAAECLDNNQPWKRIISTAN